MITEYINAAMKIAHYEIIEDEEPYYGEIPELKGVWATGKTLEECRDNLSENLEGWILVRNSPVGRNKPVRAQARTGVSGTLLLDKPETPPCATPFDKLRTGLGGLIPAYALIRSRNLSALFGLSCAICHQISSRSFSVSGRFNNPGCAMEL
jgi:hypothetical protein